MRMRGKRRHKERVEDIACFVNKEAAIPRSRRKSPFLIYPSVGSLGVALKILMSSVELIELPMS